MALNIIDNTGTTGGAVSFGGVPAGTHLLNQLNVLSLAINTAAGHALLNPILTNATAYEVLIKHGGATATAGLRVTVNIDQTSYDGGKIAGGLKADGDKEFVESTIFELVNASNAGNYALLQTNLINGNSNLHIYANAKADIEAEASWTVARILVEASAPPLNYACSRWGRKHVDEVAGQGLGQYQLQFRAGPHDASAGPGDPKSLPTWEFYGFNTAWEIAAAKAPFTNGMAVVFTNVTKGQGPGRKTLQLKAFMTNALGTEKGSVSKDNKISATYYHLLTTLLTPPYGPAMPANLAVTWRGPVNSAVPWTLTAAMVLRLTQAPTWATKLANALKAPPLPMGRGDQTWT